MRKLRFVSALLCGAMAVTMMPQVLSADGVTVAIDETNFPDPVFRGYISEHFDADKDDVLDEEELSLVTNISIMDGIGLTDLTGIKNFTELDTLIVRWDLLASLDVSGMTKLYHLDVEHNLITSLDLSGATAIRELNCGDNRMSTLDLSGLSGLEFVLCNNVTSLHSITNMASDSLEILALENVGISELDISRCPNIINLRIAGAPVTTLDLSNNRALVENMARCELVIDDAFQDFEYFHYRIWDEEVDNAYYTQFTCNQDVQIIGPDGAAVPTPTPPVGVEGFVERLYSVALGRDSDREGRENWVIALETGCTTGADVARGFLYSPEFNNRNLSTNDFVTVLYRTFFGREPDQAGLDSWVSAIDGGTSREVVINGFIDSVEWANLCCRYDIISGGAAEPTVDREPNEATIDFATRLYTTCLNREADPEGLMAWARQLANQRDTGTGAARGFFFSEEFTRQNVSNDEFVNRLYRTFMGREADEAGFTAWVAQLDNGVSREEVFNGFAESPEFSRICASYGIIR